MNARQRRTVRRAVARELAGVTSQAVEPGDPTHLADGRWLRGPCLEVVVRGKRRVNLPTEVRIRHGIADLRVLGWGRVIWTTEGA